MKRWIAWLAALAMMAGAGRGGSALAENAEGETASGEERTETALLDDDETENPEGEEAGEEYPWIEYDYEELRVGNPTPMDGKFFTGRWGNATSDIDVRSLVHGYRLAAWDGELGFFRENQSVVSGLAVIDDEEEQTRIYVLSLYDDLFFSDGTPITAWDYAFSILFQGHPILHELGAVPLDLSYLQGYEEFYAGETKYLAGVRVLQDQVLQITVKQESLPFFFEFFRLSFEPFPIYEIAPGCKVYDDGDGCYIANENPNLGIELFSREELEATVLDPEEGYLSHPTVGSGPYVLTGWDGETCTFEINPYFKGDKEWQKPTIPRLEYTLAVNEDMIDKLLTGEFGLLNKVTREDTIQRGMQETGGRQQYTFTNYPRIGLTFLIFTPDRPAFQQKAVRQAIAYCMEKEKVVEEYTAGFGLAMDGQIGLGQWMYQLITGTIPYPVEELAENASAAEHAAYDEEIAQWEELTLDNLKHYDLNIEEAVRLLEEAGWTLNERGEAFRPGEDAIRCREIDGQIVKLDLTCAYPETNITAESFDRLFIPHLAEAGIRLTMIPMDMKTLLRSYNDREIEQIDIFYLGDDFNIEYDPRMFFLPGEEGMEEEDTLAGAHRRMYLVSDEMVTTEPRAIYDFMVKWIKMQEELSEELPLIPVYSNVYFDFYTRELHGYDILPKVTWGDAIVGSWMDSIDDLLAAEAAEAEAMEDEDGELELDD